MSHNLAHPFDVQRPLAVTQCLICERYPGDHQQVGENVNLRKLCDGRTIDLQINQPLRLHSWEPRAIRYGGLIIEGLRCLGGPDDDPEDAEQCLLGHAEILGIDAYVYFIRVIDDPVDGQTPIGDPHGRFEVLRVADTCAYGTCKVPGFEGEYVFFIHPFGD